MWLANHPDCLSRRNPPPKKKTSNDQFEQINKKTVNIWEYKVGNNANIANSVWLWKTQKNYFIYRN